MKKVIYLLSLLLISFNQLIAQGANGNPYDDGRALYLERDYKYPPEDLHHQ